MVGALSCAQPLRFAGQDDWTLMSDMAAETPRLSHLGDFPLLIGGFVQLGNRSMAILIHVHSSFHVASAVLIDCHCCSCQRLRDMQLTIAHHNLVP